MIDFITSTCSNFGWYKFDNDFLKISNTIPCGVYAFTTGDNKPENNVFPFHLEDVFYIGQTGGHDDDLVIDCKMKNGKKPRYSTTFHNRIKEHRKSRGKVTECISSYFYMEKSIYIFVAQPKENIQFVKSWLLKVESDMIYEYSLLHNTIPYFNEAHKSNRKLIAEKYRNSHTQKLLDRRKNSITLEQFL